jgi:cysteine desulfurase
MKTARAHSNAWCEARATRDQGSEIRGLTAPNPVGATAFAPFRPEMVASPVYAMLSGDMTGAHRVYFDYNATAPIRPEVRRAIEPILFSDPADGAFGNPSSVHWAGQIARKYLESARTRIAARLARKPSEIIFTSGGSEADNLALFGVALNPRVPHRRVIISAVEHPAVLAAADRLRELGVAIEIIGVDREGRLELDALERALEKPASLISVMAVNNETGVISPIDRVLELAKQRGVFVHVDAVQATGRVALPLAADLYSLSGHKIGAPKGVGVLVKREHVPLRAEIVGGPQERGHRAGTESVVAAEAMATALEVALDHADRENVRLGALREKIDRTIAEIPGARVLGAGAPRVANTTTAVFSGVDGDAILQALDLAGVAASSGSACSSGSLEPSHVLLAMGVPPREALAAVRFSMGFATNEADVETLLRALPQVAAAVRQSPHL